MTFDEAMAVLEDSSPIGHLAESFTFTLGDGASSSPALRSADDPTPDLSTPLTDVIAETLVNKAERKWRLVRMPERLAQRLERLAGETHLAHQQGRITLPTAFADAVPMWLVVERALDEVEARRARSARPRRPRQTPSSL
jgi:hypothetical protein